MEIMNIIDIAIFIGIGYLIAKNLVIGLIILIIILLGAR